MLFASGGSLYSRFGLGDIQYASSALAAGMGGAGLALADSRYINRVNPALLSVLKETRLSGDFYYAKFLGETDFASASQASGGFYGTGIAFPVSGFVFSAGLYPYSLCNYQQVESGTISTVEGTTSEYEFTYEGSGGLSYVPLSIGLMPLSSERFGNIRLGFSLNFMFGTFEKMAKSRYDDYSFEDSDFEANDHLTGQTFTAGFVYESKVGLFSESDQLSVGFVFNSSDKLSADRETIISASAGTDTISTSNSVVKLPESYALGFGYVVNPQLRFALDASFQKWGDFTYFNEDVSYAKDAKRISFGSEWTPSQNKRASWFKRQTYRAGFYVNQSYLTVADEDINEIGLTLGMGFPISDVSSVVDINMEYAMRGTTANGLIDERIFKIKISLNAGEKWFLQPIIE
ncbi:hypothetical protein Ctha_2498 [Chloroherpeton thalassium ATCC 35110]|uniref:Membrane protein involved in aromatic hydrocarbon degradation n=2 Tax=Chloroherpeton thalassium TaxID=100716 RepID=B3QXN2_CHLT3|nr:hypothetical protein Ctha_2498 [Chloroherpeton thalassium ATCC 35110]